MQQTDAILGDAQLFRDRLLQLVDALGRVHRDRKAAARGRADVQIYRVVMRRPGWLRRCLVICGGGFCWGRCGRLGGITTFITTTAAAATARRRRR